MPSRLRDGLVMAPKKKNSDGVDVVQLAKNFAGIPVGSVFHDEDSRHFCRSRIRWGKRKPISRMDKWLMGRVGDRRVLIHEYVHQRRVRMRGGDDSVKGGAKGAGVEGGGKC